MDMVESILRRITQNQTEVILGICRGFGVERGSQKRPVQGDLSVVADPFRNSKFLHLLWTVVAFGFATFILCRAVGGGDWAEAGHVVTANTVGGDTVVVTPAHYHREIKHFDRRVAVATNTFPDSLMTPDHRICVASQGPPPVAWLAKLANRQPVLKQNFGDVQVVCFSGASEGTQ